MPCLPEGNLAPIEMQKVVPREEAEYPDPFGISVSTTVRTEFAQDQLVLEVIS